MDITKIKQLAEEGKNNEAIGKLKDYLDENPHDTEALGVLASIYFDLEIWEEAEKYARQLVELSPDSSKSWCNLGVILRKSNQLEAALQAQKQARKFDAKDRRIKTEIKKTEGLIALRNTQQAEQTDEVFLAPNQMYCSHCKQVIHKSAKFCKHCRARLDGREQEEKQQQEEQQEPSVPIPTVQPQTGVNQATTVNVKNDNTALWVLLGCPIGCIVLPTIFCLIFGVLTTVIPLVLVVAMYGAPMIIAGGISLYIWYKHPGKKEERNYWIGVALVTGVILTVMLWTAIYYMGLTPAI